MGTKAKGFPLFKIE